jgi:hypothetical protein
MAKDMDSLEVIFYAWKLHTRQAGVLRAVQCKYQQAARLYRCKTCFLALAFYSASKRQKEALYQRLLSARNLQKARLITSRWRALAQRETCKKQSAILIKKRKARVLRAWLAAITFRESDLTGAQLQHWKSISHYSELHMFRSFCEGCEKSARSRYAKQISVKYYTERLQLKTLLSIRLWIKQQLEQQSQTFRASEHYQQTLASKAFAVLADNAFQLYTARLALGSWLAQAKHHIVLKKYLLECGLEAFEGTNTTARTSRNGSEVSASFVLENDYELTIE